MPLRRAPRELHVVLRSCPSAPVTSTSAAASPLATGVLTGRQRQLVELQARPPLQMRVDTLDRQHMLRSLTRLGSIAARDLPVVACALRGMSWIRSRRRWIAATRCARCTSHARRCQDTGRDGIVVTVAWAIGPPVAVLLLNMWLPPRSFGAW